MIIDDHSRFIVGMRTMTTPDRQDTVLLLERCFSLCGMPKVLLTDHGPQFYSVRSGVSVFGRFCLREAVERILAR